MIDLNLNPSTRELRVFGALSTCFLVVASMVVLRRTGSSAAASGIGGVAILAGILAIAAPRALKPAFVLLMVASYPFGWLTSHVLMALIFYLVVTPLGVIMRLTGRDPMARMFERGRKSYWIPRRADSDWGRYFRQF